MLISTQHRSLVSNQNGQSLIEFVLLMLVLIMLSFSVYRGFNYAMSERWKAFIGIIANPTTTPIEF
jgi:Flp pilus assembly protein TadG